MIIAGICQYRNKTQGMPCYSIDSDCGPGYSCTGDQNKTCERIPLGTPCSDYGDCEFGTQVSLPFLFFSLVTIIILFGAFRFLRFLVCFLSFI